MSLYQRIVTPRRKLAGFTLLEVMVAVVILAVGLSALFTSEAGAIRIAQRARTTTIATLLARCKMAEVEEKVAKEGLPQEEEEGNDDCCEDGEQDGYKCEWKVARVKLPEADVGEDEDADDKLKKLSTGNLGGSSSGSKNPFGGANVLDAVSGLSKDPNEKLTGITDFLSGGGTNISSAVNSGDLVDDKDKDKDKDERNPLGKDRKTKSSIDGTAYDPMASMVMGMAFPMLRPVIQEGTRRASVIVRWKEGANEQQFELVQFLVSEQQIILPDSDDDDGGVAATTGTTGTTGSTTGTTTGTTSTTTGATK